MCRAAGSRVVSRKAENRRYGEEQLWLPDTSVPVSRWVVTAATAASSGEMHGANGQRERGLFIFCSECLSCPVMIVRVIRCKWMFSRLLALVSAADKWLLCEARAAFGPGDREVFLCVPCGLRARNSSVSTPVWVGEGLTVKVSTGSAEGGTASSQEGQRMNQQTRNGASDTAGASEPLTTHCRFSGA